MQPQSTIGSALSLAGSGLLLGILLLGGCTTTSAPEEASTSLTAGPVFKAAPDEETLRVQQLFIRGMSRALIGDHQQAVFLFEQAIQLDPSQPAILHALAESHAEQGELDQALYYSQRATRLDPTNRAYLMQHAALQQRDRNRQGALRSYQRWLTVYPGDTEVRLLVGDLLVEMGREQDALAHYRDILARDGENLEVRYQMLQLYNGLGNTDGMLQTVEAMLEYDPTNADLLLIKSDIHLERAEMADAIAALEQVIENDPGNVEATIHLSELYWETGQEAEAKRLASAALEDPAAGPGNRLAVAAQLYTRADSDDEAAERADRMLTQLIAGGNTSAEALFMLGNLRFRDERYAEAADLLEQALEVDPRHPAEWARAATCRLRAGHAAQALAVADEGLMLFPGQYPLLRTAGEAASETGDYQLAITYWTEALEVLGDAPSNSEMRGRILELIGDAYSSMSDPDRATEFWRMALDADPDLDSARMKLDSHP